MQQENNYTSKTTPSIIDSLRDEVFQKNQLLRIDEVCELTTLGKSTINLWVAQAKFPKPIHLSPTIKVWRLNDISNWIQSNLQGIY
jgi:prophage regulatory protein